ncbi:MAG: hypothetical protein KUG55_03535 [Cycloclasticus sp.]|jgi:hypothetical protein|nr:MAG: hypothetical protein AXW16_00715 [Cycloclasticus sp. Phe_18]MBV1912680.1 hypothetical protein [Cycloclasticus sp.]MDF1689447.1 hypothetical protein [Cycloclasticus sp.]MEE4291306.1 hypothetical protein [Cycloclasticus sp.]
MLNHLAKILPIFLISVLLVACHKAPSLDKALALKLLDSSYLSSGYTINLVTNNPHARGKKATGWNCADKKSLVSSGVVLCKESGRSGVYLKFTSEGEKLLVGSPWGDNTLRNARVIAVLQQVDEVQSIEMIDASHAIINYTWLYNQHTPFSNPQLEKTIALNVPQPARASAVLNDNEWTIIR